VTAPAIAAGETVYDRVARAPHWLVAALAVFVLSLGGAIAGAPRNTPTRDLLLVMHRSVGVTILAVVLFRAIWRGRHPPPPLPPTVMGLERVSPAAPTPLLYLLLIAMPLAGYVDAVAAGHAVSVFGIVSIPPILAENNWLSQVAIAVHLVGSISSTSLSCCTSWALCAMALSNSTACSTAFSQCGSEKPSGANLTLGTRKIFRHARESGHPGLPWREQGATDSAPCGSGPPLSRGRRGRDDGNQVFGPYH
jgi:cytochrome b561